MYPMLRRPIAWIPIALSLLVVVFWVAGLSMNGAPAREVDEGSAAHLFQLWLASEVVLVAFFAFKWLPREPRATMLVLVLQIALVIAGCFPVYFFHL